MPRTRPPYPPEFRLEAVRLARTSGQSINRPAQDLGVCYETLRHWVRQAGVDAGQAESLTSEDRKELRRLRRENRLLREEREILKKAAVGSAGHEGSRRSRSREARLHRHGAEPSLGRRHHLRTDLGGLALPRRGDRHPQPPLRGLVEEGRSEGRARGRRPRHGRHTAPAGRWRRAPLRQRQPIREPRLRRHPAQRGRHGLDGQPRRCLSNAAAESLTATIKKELMAASGGLHEMGGPCPDACGPDSRSPRSMRRGARSEVHGERHTDSLLSDRQHAQGRRDNGWGVS